MKVILIISDSFRRDHRRLSEHLYRQPPGVYTRTGVFVADPKGPVSGIGRVLRGGSWYHDPEYCRAALRSWYSPGFRCYIIGFRVVVESDPTD